MLRRGPVITLVVSEMEAVARANHVGPVAKKQRITTTTQVRKAKWAGVSVSGGSVVVVCCRFDGGTLPPNFRHGSGGWVLATITTCRSKFVAKVAVLPRQK